MISIDSSAEWLSNVGDATRDASTKPLLLHVDIGKLREWGYPIEKEKESLWPNYHEGVWQRPESRTADLYFVDGRFRVACFAQCVLHGAPGAFIAIHDFENRPHYHSVRTIAREVARANNMSVFQRPAEIDSRRRATAAGEIPTGAAVTGRPIAGRCKNNHFKQNTPDRARLPARPPPARTSSSPDVRPERASSAREETFEWRRLPRRCGPAA